MFAELEKINKEGASHMFAELKKINEEADQFWAGQEKLSQRGMMQKALEDGRLLTRMDCLQEFGIMNPTARISELRAAGIPIVTRMVGIHNRWDVKVKVAQWFIPDQDKPLTATKKRK